jgi:hypothetical protein
VLAALSLALLQFDYGGFRPWAIVHAVMPGADAIRYTFRAQIVANLAMALAVAGLIARWPRRAAVLAGLVLIAEQANTRYPASTSRALDMSLMARVAERPAACRAFVLVPDPAPEARRYWEYQADAMVIAQVLRVPTLNGYLTWLPDGWTLERPDDARYAGGVSDWIARHRLQGVCWLDPVKGVWAPTAFRVNPLSADVPSRSG